jgi:hypothetical protein
VGGRSGLKKGDEMRVRSYRRLSVVRRVVMACSLTLNILATSTTSPLTMVPEPRRPLSILESGLVLALSVRPIPAG